MLLNLNFDEIARFAATERLLRGVGGSKEYDYTLQDVLEVSHVYTQVSNPCDVDFSNVFLHKKQVLNLHNAYKRWKQQV